MTIRTILNKKKRRVAAVAYFGMAVLALGLFLGGLHPAFFAVAILGYATSFLTIFYAFTVGFPCPKCGVPWASVAMNAMNVGNLFSIDRRIKFCPFCGSDVDQDIMESV